MSTDQLAADLIDAGLSSMQLAVITTKLAGAQELTMVIREQSEYGSGLYNDMITLFPEISEGIESLLDARQRRHALDYPWDTR